jgi:histone acetyltransferase (RNA polymerase elongator complex component)
LFAFRLPAFGVFMIIPFFIPHLGCPHQCVFCNQQNITGQDKSIDPASIPYTILQYLNSNNHDEPVQVAFYGGSFTALTRETQKSYLEAVQPFIQAGNIKNIRLSTRPDGISGTVLSFLRKHHVETIELGVQSMDDRILHMSGRGHTAADTMHAVSLLKKYNFTIGLQLMVGLPGDSAVGFLDTVGRVIKLKPDFVRIYPLLVIKGTPLEELYKTGRYTPLPLDTAVSQCSAAMLRFAGAGIEVIRVGLQPTEELEEPGTIIAGPYHPSFRQLVESAILLEKMRSELRKRKEKSESALFTVNPADLSAAIGQHRENIGHLKKEYGLHEIRIKADKTILKRGVPILLED